MPLWTFPDGSEFIRAEGPELDIFTQRFPWIRGQVQIALQKSAQMYLAHPGSNALYRRHLMAGVWLLSFDGLRQADHNGVVLIIVNPSLGMARDRAEQEFRRLGLGASGT